jgi:stage V sporulation protein B
MKHLIKQTTFLTLSGILTRILALVFFVVLARSLSVSDYGLFRYLLTLSMIYAIAFTGIHLAMSKKVSENKSLITPTSNSFILTLLIFILLSIIIILFQEHPVLLILFVFAALIDSFYLGFVRGMLNYVKLAGFKLLENVIQLIILVIAYLAYQKIDFNFSVIFYSFSGIAALIIFEIIKNELKLNFNFSKKISQEMVMYSIPVMLGAVGWSLMFGINAIFIKSFYGNEQVAFYSIGETVVQVFTFLPAAISTIVLPKVSSLRDKSKILKPLKMAVLATITTSVLMLCILLLFRNEIINIVFSQKYIEAAIVIIPLAISIILISIHNIYAAVFQGLGKPGIPSITISIAAVFNIVGSYFLTKTYGIMGAAISNAITSSIALILIVIIFGKQWKTLSKI